MSLSKFGLPATRTGIVIAREEIIEMVSEMNAVMSLSTASLGAAIGDRACANRRTGSAKQRSDKTLLSGQGKMGGCQQLCGLLDGIDFHIHKPEGAFFLWLWLPGLKITDAELYRRLKKRGVLIVPGHYFFPGLEDDWEHKQQCIRISYAQDIEKVEAGLKIIADEIKLACKPRIKLLCARQRLRVCCKDVAGDVFACVAGVVVLHRLLAFAFEHLR